MKMRIFLFFVFLLSNAVFAASHEKSVKVYLANVGERWVASDATPNGVPGKDYEILTFYFPSMNYELDAFFEVPDRETQRLSDVPISVCRNGLLNMLSKNTYRVCDSKFSVVDKSATAVLHIGSAGALAVISAALASTYYLARIDYSALASAVKISGAREVAESAYQKDWFSRAVNERNLAERKSLLDGFVSYYTKNRDVNGLVVGAKKIIVEEVNPKIYRERHRVAVSSREENLLIEFVAAYSDMDYENLVPQVSEILSEVQRSRQEAEKRSAEVENAKFQARLRIKEQERNDVEAFRKNLSIAKDTHCGLVVEIKPELIKIQTMVGERWFKRSQVFPVGYRCRFMNGAYEDIYL